MGVDVYTCDNCGDHFFNDNDGESANCRGCGAKYCCRDCADESNFKPDVEEYEDDCDMCHVTPKQELTTPLYMVMRENGKLIKTGKGMGIVGTYDTIGSAKRLATRRGGKVIKVTEYELVE